MEIKSNTQSFGVTRNPKDKIAVYGLRFLSRHLKTAVFHPVDPTRAICNGVESKRSPFLC
jgi:hypothetical protein